MKHSTYILEITRDEAEALLPYIPDKDTKTKRVREILTTIATEETNPTHRPHT
jgi:hypothetical protein